MVFLVVADYVISIVGGENYSSAPILYFGLKENP